MDTPREPGYGHKSPEEQTTTPPEGEGYFQAEFEFLDTLSNLVDTLKRFKAPDRKSTHLELLGGNNDLRTIPEDLQWIPGIDDLSSIHISLINEDNLSTATTIALYGDFGKIHLSRDSDSVTDDKDVLFANDGTPNYLPRVPNSQINDFLYSLTRRGQDPALIRMLADDKNAELVIGDEMADALNDCAVASSTYYEYQLGSNRSLRFSLEGGMDGTEKLSTVDLYYQDKDMEKLAVHIIITEGLNIQFQRMQPAYESTTSPIFPDRIDYLIAQRVIREIIREYTQNPTTNRLVSLEDVSKEELESIQIPESD